jgi:maltose alpha-D-glucosyltransferase / alpha-amylase
LFLDRRDTAFTVPLVSVSPSRRAAYAVERLCPPPQFAWVDYARRREAILDIQDLWYKNAVVYALEVEAFQDSNGDGIGDFAGLTRRLAYLAGLGVTCVWLHPFYTSPRRDDGYDVSDYYSVDPRFGDLGDFVEFAHQAETFGIRIVIDLVVNHTSIEHPWFRAARVDPTSPFRDYYVWSDKQPKDVTSGIVFPGHQKSIWTLDRKAGAWYYHRFYDFQPDLNFANPAVRREIHKIMGFWLELGVSGFRVDALPFLIEDKRPDVLAEPKDYRYLEEMRQFLAWRAKDAIVLGEANVELSELPQYFGDGNRVQMLFNFYLNQQIFNAIARQDAAPLIRALESLPTLPDTSQWGSFLRNHDEIDLGRLTEAERQHAFAVFGPKRTMQLYNRGIRRRLAPMLGNDMRRVMLAYSIMFTLPGTPVLRYGEEIGMGDLLSLRERAAIRTPMQWSDEPNAGFSTAPPNKLVRPLIRDGEFGFPRLNVEQQRREPTSLLNSIERMIRLRKEHPEFGFGECAIIDSAEPSVFAIRSSWQANTSIAVHNLAARRVNVRLAIPGADTGHLLDALGGDRFEPRRDGLVDITLEPYGFRWLRLRAMPQQGR